MKRLFALLLTVAMLIGMTSAALAYDEEITFQDIPWGTTLEEYDAILRDNKIAFCSFYARQITKGWVFAKEDNGKIVFSKKDAEQVPVLGFDTGSLEKEIGGYASGGIHVHCILDNGSWKVHAVSLKFNINSEEEAYSDLSLKLESLYGEKSVGTDDGYEYYYWLGANNTCIVLTSPSWGSITRDDWPDVVLYYGTTDAEELLSTAINNFQSPSNNTESTTNGL